MADSTGSWKVWFFAPNLIGYLRIIFTIWAYAIAFYDPTLCLVLYLLGFILDAVDGMVARMVGQSSRFGAVLDMLTDRAATSGFLLMLSHLMGPEYAFPIAGLVCLDVASHFARMYATTTAGCSSHKDTSGSRFGLLTLYYSKKWFMALLCIGQEVYYMLLYVRETSKRDMISKGTFPITNVDNALVGTMIKVVLAPFVLKQVCNVLQMVDALQSLAEVDMAERNAASGDNNKRVATAEDKKKK